MNRRSGVAILATVLAVAGAVLLWFYVRGADERAIAGQQPTSVLVVTKLIQRGAAAEAIADSVEARQLPAIALVPGAINNLGDIAGQVAGSDLQVGEQLLKAKFVDPSSEEATQIVPVPDGMEQVSIVLEPQRVMGSRLKAGDTVGIIGSFKFKPADKNADDIEASHLILNKVLVTRAQGVAPTEATRRNNDDESTQKAPSASVMVTLAVNAGDAEKIVFAAEFGSIWLTQQGPRSDQTDSRIITAGNIYGNQKALATSKAPQ